MTIAGEPLRPQGFRRTMYNLIHSRITSQVSLLVGRGESGILGWVHMWGL
jgi:hypothetical protein